MNVTKQFNITFFGESLDAVTDALESIDGCVDVEQVNLEDSEPDEMNFQITVSRDLSTKTVPETSGPHGWTQGETEVLDDFFASDIESELKMNHACVFLTKEAYEEV